MGNYDEMVEPVHSTQNQGSQKKALTRLNRYLSRQSIGKIDTLDQWQRPATLSLRVIL